MDLSVNLVQAWSCDRVTARQRTGGTTRIGRSDASRVIPEPQVLPPGCPLGVVAWESDPELVEHAVDPHVTRAWGEGPGERGLGSLEPQRVETTRRAGGVGEIGPHARSAP